ncbi:unnamed protein product [Sympodiomycopsis kandeliae]
MALFLSSSRVATTSRCLLPRQASSAPSPLDNISSLFSALPRNNTSASPSSTPSCARHLSKKAKAPRVGLSKAQRRKGQLQKQANLEKKSLKAELMAITKPDPILGYCPGNRREAGTNDEALWENCELRQIILSKDEVWGLEIDRRGNLLTIDTERAKGTELERLESQEFGGPLRLNYGFTAQDRNLLFKDLPEVTTEDRIVHSETVFGQGAGLNQTSGVTEASAQEVSMIEEQEQISADRLSRILDLKNASGKGIDVENKRRILEHFGKNEKDVGSVEAQAALMTYRLHLLHSHLAQPRYRKDNSTRRHMTQIVHQRAKLLKYLRRSAPQKYRALLPRIGVNPRAVEGEIVVGGRPNLTIEAGS